MKAPDGVDIDASEVLKITVRSVRAGRVDLLVRLRGEKEWLYSDLHLQEGQSVIWNDGQAGNSPIGLLERVPRESSKNPGEDQNG